MMVTKLYEECAMSKAGPIRGQGGAKGTLVVQSLIVKQFAQPVSLQRSMEPDVAAAEVEIGLERSRLGPKDLHKPRMRVSDAICDVPQDINFRNLLALSENRDLVDRFPANLFFVEGEDVTE